MKKYQVLALTVLLCLFLCACENTPAATEVTATFPTVAEGEQKKLAFTCQNYDFDVYTYCSWQPGFIFYILSEEYVAPEGISVTVPVDWQYSVHVTDSLPNGEHYQLTSYSYIDGDAETGLAVAEDDSTLNYQLYLYRASRGMDWKGLGQKLIRWKTLGDQWEELYDQGLADTPEAHAISKAGGQAGMEYRKIANSYVEEYRKLQAADLPQFHLYRVEVFFQHDSSAENTSFREIEVFLGEDRYQVEIGEIRLHSEEAGNTAPDDPALKLYSSGPMDHFSYPYGPGIEKREGFVLRADADVTLLSCTQLESSICSAEILEIHLTMADDPYGTGAMDMIWDGKTPLLIPQGKYVQFNFLIQDDRMKEIFYGENLYPTVTYKHNEETYTLTSQLSMLRQNYEPWYWYAICFQGLDLESYFNDYYYVAVSTWRNDLQ